MYWHGSNNEPTGGDQVENLGKEPAIPYGMKLVTRLEILRKNTDFYIFAEISRAK
jgi:hypothetical protein